MIKRAIIVDLDNTLYNWADSYTPSFRAQLHVLSRELNVDEEELKKDFKAVFSKYDTVEYPNAIRELSVWTKTSLIEEEKERIVNLSKQIFSNTLSKNLCLYPNIKKVLIWAKQQDIAVVGLTDTLHYWAMFRLRHLGIEKYISEIYSWQTRWFEERSSKKYNMDKVCGLVNNQLKPNTNILIAIIEKLKVDNSRCFLVGDSLAKDIYLAQQAHIVDVWAKYGTKFKEKSLKTLKEITPWSEEKRTIEKSIASQIKATYEIDDFIQVLDIVGSDMQMNLFTSR